MYQNILRLEGIMVLLVLCGVALRRRKLITDEGQDCLTDLMTTLILPCNIFLSFPQQMDLAMLRSFFLTILISVLVMAASALLGRAVYGRREEHESKVFQYGLINSNAMFNEAERVTGVNVAGAFAEHMLRSMEKEGRARP